MTLIIRRAQGQSELPEIGFLSGKKKKKHRLKVDSEHNCLHAEMVSIAKNIEYSLVIQHNEVK